MNNKPIPRKKGLEMKWFKVPSNLSLKADWKDRYVIIEYGCLYAQLEREPTEKELSKQLTPKQRERLAEWLPTLREQLAKDLAETGKNRKSRNINYEKTAGLKHKTTPYNIPYSNPNNTKTIQPQIREEENNKENIYKKKFTVDSIISVNGQDFIQFPPESMSLLKKYWTDSKIESIRKDLASMYPHETTVAVLLTKYESDKTKKSTFTPPTLEEWLDFCTEKGLKQQRMTEAYEGYECAGWKDSRGNQIKNWKQKILNVWCKDENREIFPTKPQTI